MNTVNQTFTTCDQAEIKANLDRQTKLKSICDQIQNFESIVIVLEGRCGSGKSSIIEALVTEKANIFTSSTMTPYNGVFDITPTQDKYVAMDETEYFTHEQVLHFIEKAKSDSKIALISAQFITSLHEELQKAFAKPDVQVVHSYL